MPGDVAYSSCMKYEIHKGVTQLFQQQLVNTKKFKNLTETIFNLSFTSQNCLILLHLWEEDVWDFEVPPSLAFSSFALSAALVSSFPTWFSASLVFPGKNKLIS